MSKQIHCTFDDSLYEKLANLADVQGLSTQKVITDALISYINRTHNGISDNNYSYDFIDLFAGIGGMRIAFQNAGCRCVFSSEWDKNCQKTYYANFGEIPYGDITKINAKDIPNHDILVAGFPCQPFSIAGVSKKNSMGRATGFADKTQGTLFFDVCRIIAEKRPKAFMLENVKNLKSHDKGNTWKVIKSSLEELNYSVYSGVFDGQDFVPQHRERVLIVGFDKERYGEVPFEFDYKKPETKPVLKDILFEEYDKKYILTAHLWDYLQNYAAKHKAAGNGFGFGMPDLNGISRTLSARYYKDGSEILINRGEGEVPRRLTPRECARLQGYPDDFKIVVSDTQAYKQFGNSVVVPLMSAVASLIVEKLNTLKDIDYRQNKMKTSIVSSSLS
ncbi:MAG: DNA (cytosine-5-)-methyltransferase [Candidatus Ornithospirochaeta sp.]